MCPTLIGRCFVLQARYPSFLDRHSAQSHLADTYHNYNSHSAKLAVNNEGCCPVLDQETKNTAKPFKPLLSQVDTSNIASKQLDVHKTAPVPFLGSENQPPMSSAPHGPESCQYVKSGTSVHHTQSGALSLKAGSVRRNNKEVLALREDLYTQSTSQILKAGNEDFPSMCIESVENEAEVMGLRVKLESIMKEGAPTKLDSLLLELLKMVKEHSHFQGSDRQ